MDHELNQFKQPVGLPLAAWVAPAWPSCETLCGQYCRLESLSPETHGDSLYRAISSQPDDASWTYMPYGPFATREDYQKWLVKYAGQKDPQFYAIVDRETEQALGVASYLRVTPANGFIEVGHLHFSPALRRSRMATEAMWLMMQHAFSLGYRRYEWKCDRLNAPSRAAALRLGFTFEGIFRQATVVKGRNRDTAWHAIIDRDWPAIDAAFREWLEPTNFDEHGRERLKLKTRCA